ncbi:HIT domain-containing protein [Candidatus Roizmanbacteria bacterium]|jgi:diadenosine tetraphosphate (Ap4A) HIT family hydrolase|nr:HIT domain-containing protein [Candidatus Roizmanbacteria bacterium]
MDDLSEEAIKKNCPHCDLGSQAFNYFLEKTKFFNIVCDSHPLVEGHILIIPKRHVSCIADYSKEELNEFIVLNKKVSDFLIKKYKFVSSFEHGIFGQTVFHSHVHYLPFKGRPDEIVAEGKDNYFSIDNFEELKKLFKQDGGYLFFSIGSKKWSVNKNLAAPRFFRDRFAKALDRSERSNWKIFHNDNRLMELGKKENEIVMGKWIVR